MYFFVKGNKITKHLLSCKKERQHNFQPLLLPSIYTNKSNLNLFLFHVLRTFHGKCKSLNQILFEIILLLQYQFSVKFNASNNRIEMLVR